MYRMVAIDLDGTLLNSHKEISDENEKYIKLAIEKGIRIVICSGRIFAGAKIFADRLSVKEPLIVCNGAVIKDVKTSEAYYTNMLSKEDSNRVIDILKKEDIYFHVYIDDVMYTERLDYSAVHYMVKSKDLRTDYRIDIKVVESVKDIIAESRHSPPKIVVISRNMEALKKARSYVEDIKTVEVMSSNYDNFEVLNRGVNKGKALEILSTRLNVRKEEIMAIGDNENDYSMIEYAGFGVAMENAEESIKNISDFVTFSNDDNGVACAIKKFVL